MTEACGPSLPYCIGEGKCVACRGGDTSDCGQPTKDCFVPTCTEEHVCISRAIEEGKPANLQDPSGCLTNLCTSTNTTKPSYADAGIPCPATASTGVCNGKGVCGLCKPGDTRCTSNSLDRYDLCDEQGQWDVGVMKCDADAGTPVCSAGVCGGIKQVTAGDRFTCALADGGDVFCWGVNTIGQLGLGAGTVGTSFSSPKRVPGLTLITQLASAEKHTCALRSGGDIYCWGSNANAELGSGTSPTKPGTPTLLSGDTKYQYVAASRDNSCAVATSGALWCWGRGALLGSPDLYQSSPLLISTIPENSKQAAVGQGVVCALASSGSVYCWGSNSVGESGAGTSVNYVPVSQPAKVANGQLGISAGNSHVVSNATWTHMGSVWSTYTRWGSNKFKQLDTSANTVYKAPTFEQGSSLSPEFAGFDAVGRVTSFGTLELRGNGQSGAFGTGSGGSTISYALFKVAGVALGATHTCAWQASGKMWCWGDNASGQLGLGTTSNQTAPVEISWKN